MRPVRRRPGDDESLGHDEPAFPGEPAVRGLLTPGPAGGPPHFAVDVLDVVERIPAGMVLSYGDVAELVGRGGPRSVGRVLSRYGSGVPWWRVLRADGSVGGDLLVRALPRYRAEGTPMRADGARVDMRRARWDGGTGRS